MILTLGDRQDSKGQAEFLRKWGVGGRRDIELHCCIIHVWKMTNKIM